MVLVNTVDNIKSKYTNCDYFRAVLARNLQNIISRPSAQTYLAIIDKNQLHNCPISQKDILAAEGIFGPNLEGH
jgi:hypothetical protein